MNEFYGLFTCREGDKRYELNLSQEGTFKTRGDSFLCDSGSWKANGINNLFELYDSQDSLIGLAKIRKIANMGIELSLLGTNLTFNKEVSGFNSISRVIDKRIFLKVLIDYKEKEGDSAFLGFRPVQYYFKKQDSINSVKKGKIFQAKQPITIQ